MELLKQLYEIYSPSNGEKKLKKFIKRWVRDNVEDAIIRTDNNDGNVYIMRGESDTYPCVVAHLDQVQHNHSADFKAVETEDIIFGYSPSKRCREGLGADDKNGIWIALQCLQEFDVIKVAFFVGEEIGCIGSGRCDMSYFKDCRFIIEPDRRGCSDLITSISGRICSKEFEEALHADWFGYAPTSGMMTDVLELSERGVGLSCINLSCGYFDPHTDDEYTVKSDLYNCLALVRNAIATITDVYPYEYEYSYGSYYGYSYGGYGSSRLSYSGSDYFKKWYGDDDSDSKKKSTLYDVPKIVYVREYADLDSWVDQLMYQNYRFYNPEDLWPYVESDLATYEVTEETFMELAWSYYEYYWEIEEYNQEYSDEGYDWLKD